MIHVNNGHAIFLIAIERFSKQPDQQQAAPAKRILESIMKIPSLAAVAITAQPAESKSLISSKPASAPAIPAQAVLSKTVHATKLSLLTATYGAPNEGTPTSQYNNTVGLSSSQTIVATCNQKTRKDSVIQRVGDKSAPVFLSYQSAFTARVLQLKRALEARGIPCWMATEDLVGNVQDAIGEVLMVTPAIIICYSNSYRDSMYDSKFQYVKYERMNGLHYCFCKYCIFSYFAFIDIAKQKRIWHFV